MDLDLRRLRWFVAVAHELHFGRAATRLSISQPALSASIARLEAELGVQLFDRNLRAVRLTPAGEELLREAPALLDHAATIAAGLRRSDADLTGELDFGYSRTSGWALVPEILDAMAERCPRVLLTAREAWAVDLRPAVSDGRIDVAMVNFGDPARGLRRTTLGAETQGVLVSDRHRLAGRSSVSLADLDGERWQLWPRRFDPRYHDWILEQLGRPGRAVHLIEEPNPSPPHRLDLDERTVRLAVRSCLDLVPPGFTFLALEPPLEPVPLDLVWRSDRETPQLRRFIEVARTVARATGRPAPAEPRLHLVS